MMVILALCVGFLATVCVLCPFWLGPGGKLDMSSSLIDLEQAQKLKQGILKRYIMEEKSYQEGYLIAYEWNRRKSFLINRYIDTVRRIDFIQKANQG